MNSNYDDSAHNEEIADLQEAIERYANNHGLRVDDHTRKNVVTLRLGGRITIDLGYCQERKGMAPGVVVGGGDLQCRFEGVPPKKEFFALISAHLGID